MDFVKDSNSYGKVVISTRDYFDMIRAERDLEILRKSYVSSNYGISVDVLRAVFGNKPAAPKPDPADVAATAAITAADAAKKAAAQVEDLIKQATGGVNKC